jgi:hypothetical protein
LVKRRELGVDEEGERRMKERGGRRREADEGEDFIVSS